VLELVSTVEASHHPRDRRSFLDIYGPVAVDRQVVAAIVEEDGPDGSATPFLLLSPFGETAVDVLFAELAEEPDRGRRAALLGVLRQLAPGRSEPVVRRLDDSRWYVVRNAVNVLRYSRHPRSLDLLAEAAKHAAEAVRREAVYGLAAGGAAAVPYLGALATSADASVRILAVEALRGLAAPESATALVLVVSSRGDIKTRRSALDALAEHPSPEASSALLQFARRGQARPRLPRSLRRRAQALVRAHPGGAR
jgi:HEAT repeat protein